MYSVNREANGSESLINLVVLSFPSADLGGVCRMGSLRGERGGKTASHDIRASGARCAMNQSGQ